jgi:hypothetical protein
VLPDEVHQEGLAARSRDCDRLQAASRRCLADIAQPRALAAQRREPIEGGHVFKNSLEPSAAYTSF